VYANVIRGRSLGQACRFHDMAGQIAVGSEDQDCQHGWDRLRCNHLGLQRNWDKTQLGH